MRNRDPPLSLTSREHEIAKCLECHTAPAAKAGCGADPDGRPPLFADDDWAVAIYRATGSRNGIDLDVAQALVIRVADGLWQDVTAVPLDSAFERFWA